MGCHALLQGIFLTQGWNPHLLVSCTASGFFTAQPSGKPTDQEVGVEKFQERARGSDLLQHSYILETQVRSIVETQLSHLPK